MSLHRHSLPFLSSLLLWASFPPLDLGFLAWFALVPVTVYAMRERTTWKPFLLTWLAGYMWMAMSLEWIRHSVPAGPWLVSIYLGLFLAVYVWLVRRFTRSLFALALSAPMAWVALEYMRTVLLGGLPYILIGYSQHKMFLFLQIADLGGVWLVSAVVVLVNAAIARAFLVEKPSVWKDKEFRIGAIVSAAILVCSCVYGAIRVATIELREGPDLALVQPNIPQSVKRIMRNSSTKRKEARKIFRKHIDMSAQALKPAKPDLIVWPESVLYGGVYLDAESREYILEAGWTEDFQLVARGLDVPVLTGTEVLEMSESRRIRDSQIFVSAILVDPKDGIVARYDKVHLVPFAEFILLGDTFPIIKEWAHDYMGVKFLEFTPGTEFTIMKAGGEPFGVEVCFEAIYPEITREIARKGGKFVVNISNEGWFLSSAELDQMQAMTRFRAVESRIAFVRGTNTGISSFIAPTGEVDALLEVDGVRKEVEGVLRGRVRLTDAGSLYRQLGDVVAWLACGFALASLLLSWVRVRGQKP